MKLRNLLMIVCACCCITVMAQESVSTFPSKCTIEPKLRAVESPVSMKEKFEAPVSMHAARIRAEIEKESNQAKSHWIDWSQIKPLKAENKKMRLDSIIGTNPDGSNYTRQYFVFNDQNKVIQRLNSYWNSETDSWDTAEEYNFEWDEDGYILMQSVQGYGQGQRFEYVYNDRKLGIQQIDYTLDESNKWVKVQKGEYQYDDRGNMIDEMVYLWSGNEWVQASHNTATWDDQNRRASILSMTWDGTEWIGETKEDYVWHAANKLSYKGVWRWLDTKKWQLVDVFLQEFNQAGQCTLQHRNFWNDDRKDWSGEYPSWGPTGGICITYDASITYDEKGRITLQQHKECYNDSTEWFLASEMITTWKDGLENGDYESETNAYLYDYDTKKKKGNQREYERYNAQGLLTWRLQQMQNPETTEMNDLFEDKFAYDDRGNLLYSAIWDWIDGVRTPNIEERHTYDANNNIIESYYRQAKTIPSGAPLKAAGHEPQDDEGWENTSHFTYQYENGCRIKKLGWRWNGTDWSTNFGDGVEYDWNVPASDLIIIDGYADPYKINFTFNYSGDGSGDWLTATNTYYYSEEATGINRTEVGKLIFSRNILQITGGDNIDNRIYDLTGKQVYQGHNSEENLNSLIPGVYIARSLIDGEPFVLKITVK